MILTETKLFVVKMEEVSKPKIDLALEIFPVQGQTQWLREEDSGPAWMELALRALVPDPRSNSKYNRSCCCAITLDALPSQAQAGLWL